MDFLRKFFDGDDELLFFIIVFILMFTINWMDRDRSIHQDDEEHTLLFFIIVFIILVISTTRESVAIPNPNREEIT